jgi:hypothetical protein
MSMPISDCGMKRPTTPSSATPAPLQGGAFLRARTQRTGQATSKGAGPGFPEMVPGTPQEIPCTRLDPPRCGPVDTLALGACGIVDRRVVSPACDDTSAPKRTHALHSSRNAVRLSCSRRLVRAGADHCARHRNHSRRITGHSPGQQGRSRRLVVDHPYSFGSGCRDLVLHAKARRARLIRVRVSPCGSLLGHQILARAALGVGNLPGRDCPILRSWRGSLRGVSPLRAHGLAHVQLSHFGAKVGQLKSQACHAQGIEGPGGQDYSFGKPFLERVVVGCAPPSRGAGRSVGWMMPIDMRSLNASSVVRSTSFTRERSIMTR